MILVETRTNQQSDCLRRKARNAAADFARSLARQAEVPPQTITTEIVSRVKPLVDLTSNMSEQLRSCATHAAAGGDAGQRRARDIGHCFSQTSSRRKS